MYYICVCVSVCLSLCLSLSVSFSVCVCVCVCVCPACVSTAASFAVNLSDSVSTARLIHESNHNMFLANQGCKPSETTPPTGAFNSFSTPLAPPPSFPTHLPHLHPLSHPNPPLMWPRADPGTPFPAGVRGLVEVLSLY